MRYIDLKDSLLSTYGHDTMVIKLVKEIKEAFKDFSDDDTIITGNRTDTNIIEIVDKIGDLASTEYFTVVERKEVTLVFMQDAPFAALIAVGRQVIIIKKSI